MTLRSSQTWRGSGTASADRRRRRSQLRLEQRGLSASSSPEHPVRCHLSNVNDTDRSGAPNDGYWHFGPRQFRLRRKRRTAAHIIPAGERGWSKSHVGVGKAHPQPPHKDQCARAGEELSKLATGRRAAPARLQAGRGRLGTALPRYPPPAHGEVTARFGRPRRGWGR